jgi:hypothetical protein
VTEPMGVPAVEKEALLHHLAGLGGLGCRCRVGSGPFFRFAVLVRFAGIHPLLILLAYARVHSSLVISPCAAPCLANTSNNFANANLWAVTSLPPS